MTNGFCSVFVFGAFTVSFSAGTGGFWGGGTGGTVIVGREGREGERDRRDGGGRESKFERTIDRWIFST